jgi:hypothetical protein
VQEVVEQEKAANFKLQPLPDVFEDLLCPSGDRTNTAVSSASPPEATSMEEDGVEAAKSASGSPDPAASERERQPLPFQKAQFAFLGGSYSCALLLCVAHAIADPSSGLVLETWSPYYSLQQPSTSMC